MSDANALPIPLFLRLLNRCGHSTPQETCLMCEAVERIAELESQLKELTTPREVTPRLWHLDKSLKVHW